MKSVYMINGFLEAGKTEFISFTISQPYFQIKGKTLIIQCEEGEVEFDSMALARSRCIVEVIEDEEAFTPAYLTELEKKHKPDRIIIEWNGMWNYKNMKLPWYWKIEQQITIINGATFSAYFNNMKSLLAEQIRKSEMIIFNRCDKVRDELPSFRRNIKAVNQSCDVVFEDANGEIDEIFEEDLPYDLKDEELLLEGNKYGIWYLDVMDHPERYVGKKLTFLAMVMRPEGFPKGYFIPGRFAMTCCADDMAFLGYACEYKDADKLNEKDWVKVTCSLTVEKFPDYEGPGPVLHILSMEPAKEPKDAVISFS